MIPIADDPDPTIDALAKLYVLYDTKSITLTDRDEKHLLAFSDRIYALDKPSEYKFTNIEKKQIERLWDTYAKE